jgi:hypothetical protein
MTAGDTAYWDNLFVEDLIPSVLALVLDAWDRMEKPAADEVENRTTLRLYSAMIRGKDRQRHAFLIRPQDLEVDPDLDDVTGQKDIAFFPSRNDEDIYFCLEAKRLNALVSGVRQSLAHEYVTNGMQRFVDCKYSRQVRHAGMLGYVLDGDVDRAMKNVANVIRLHYKDLRMEPPGEMRPSLIRPDDAHAKETHHERQNDAIPFWLHHLFVASVQA